MDRDMLDKGMIHIQGGKEPEGVSFFHATQNKVQFKTYELFIWGIFHLIFLDCGWLRVPEPGESETAGKGDITLNILFKAFLDSFARIITISSGL